MVRTQASTAAAVARALDEARVPEILGTLAGDDTVFVAPRRASGGSALAVKLRRAARARLNVVRRLRPAEPVAIPAPCPTRVVVHEVGGPRS